MLQATQSWYNERITRVGLHLAFIAATYYCFFLLFKINSPAAAIDYIYTLLFVVTLLPVVYINLELLIPYLGKTKKWLFYVGILTLLIAVSVWLNYMFFDKWSAVLLPNLFFISYYTWWEVLLLFLAVIAISSLIKLSKSWLAMTDMQQQLLQVEKENVDIELKALKSQINPHFFFNTLNSIYAMSLEKDNRLPGTILKMSDMMRYYLYQSKDDTVPLQKELEVLDDYIDLQKLRSNEKLEITKVVRGDFSNRSIAPLLLVTFVENSFKHGAKGTTEKAQIDISIAQEGDMFYFTITNNSGVVDQEHFNEDKGLGLINVKRRLELMYPNKHELIINDSGKTFTVNLKIKL